MTGRQIPARLAAIACGLLLAGCSPAPQATPRFAAEPPPSPAASQVPLTWDVLLPIVTPMTYRDMIIEKCTMKEPSPLAPFMAELRASGASPSLIAQAEAETARLRDLERKTEAEYVCTAELFDSTEKNAASAGKAWDELKTRKP